MEQWTALHEDSFIKIDSEYPELQLTVLVGLG